LLAYLAGQHGARAAHGVSAGGGLVTLKTALGLQATRTAAERQAQPERQNRKHGNEHDDEEHEYWYGVTVGLREALDEGHTSSTEARTGRSGQGDSMDDETIDGAVQRAADMIAGASYLIAFTGAGVSADSGMPTFRGAGGLWGSYDQRHLELDFFLRSPELAWKTIREIFYTFTLSVEPNDAHRVLARWERDGLLKLIVTQNIDGLHHRAGSTAVAEFHGSCDSLVCTRCGNRTPATAELVALSPPRCSCGGVYKPGFIFFGEGIPPEAYEASFTAAGKADLCLVIGSTGSVYPAASIPRLVKSNGGRVIEVNPEPSEFTDTISNVFVQLGAAEALRRIDAALRDQMPTPEARS